jgi:hypothetical protein
MWRGAGRARPSGWPEPAGQLRTGLETLRLAQTGAGAAGVRIPSAAGPRVAQEQYANQGSRESQPHAANHQADRRFHGALSLAARMVLIE